MISIVLAAAFFVGVHLLVAGTGLRDRLVRGLGEPLYLGAFSVAASRLEFELGGSFRWYFPYR